MRLRIAVPAILGLAALTLTVSAAEPGADAGPAGPAALPQKLSQTGLFVPGTGEVAGDNMAYSPQYPLWSDGAAKRRWLYLPPGTSIDGSDPDAWKFPPGTRLWKEFGYTKPVETRFIERLSDGSWRFATYIWEPDGRDARLAPAEGVAKLDVREAPGGNYAIPSRDDCRACHEATVEPVLGVSALQLSPDRDPLAPHAEAPGVDDVDLRDLNERGLLRNLPPELLRDPPRIDAPAPNTRAALGYLHGNCGHCHNDDGPLAALDLTLQQAAAASTESLARTLETTVGYPSEFRTQDIETRVVPGAQGSSMLLARMHSRDPLVQMPPLGTVVSDAEAIAVIARWIQHDLQR